MTDDPRWHGWATPDQVIEMMKEMVQFLKENDQKNYPHMLRYIKLLYWTVLKDMPIETLIHDFECQQLGIEK